jgi:structural maintenance of chromosome 4
MKNSHDTSENPLSEGEQFSFRNMSFGNPKNQSMEEGSSNKKKDILQEIVEAENLEFDLRVNMNQSDAKNSTEEKNISSDEEEVIEEQKKITMRISTNKPRRSSVKRKSYTRFPEKSVIDSESVLDKMIAKRKSYQRREKTIDEEQTTGKRIMIKKLILENFKSYGGRHEIGPFHHHFNAIIGPNGSGKSNLIDSMVFVFGKRASKLRLKNLSELIHRGYNESDKVVTKASVEIEFVEVENDEEIPGSMFSVAREVNHRGSSKYYLNKSQVKIEKIEEFFMRMGMDLANNRFIILQGEVEKISMMKPMTGDFDRPGMLEYLEELIGSDKYVDAIKRLENELESQNEERLRLGDLSKAAFQEVKCLSSEKDKAVEFINDEKREYQLNSLELQIKRNKILNYMEENQKKKLHVKEKFEEFQMRIATVKEMNKKKEVELQELRKKTAEYKQRKNDLNDKLISNKNYYENYVSEEEKLKENKEKLEEDLERHERDINEAEKEMVMDSEEIPVAEEKIEKINEEMNELQRKLNEEEEKKRNTIMELKEEEKVYSKKIEKLKREETKKGRDLKEVEEEKEQITKEIEELKNKKKEQQESRKEYKNTIKEMDGEFEKLEEVLKDLEKHGGELSEELNELENKIRRLSNKKRELEEKLKKYDHNKSNRRYAERILEWLMDLQRDGEVKGILGRLGDLGRIHAQYDFAASTASGMLDYIVVETYEDAKKCIYLLKRNKIGRASFITLDRLEGFKKFMNTGRKYPNQCKRLFDLIGK